MIMDTGLAQYMQMPTKLMRGRASTLGLTICEESNNKEDLTMPTMPIILDAGKLWKRSVPFALLNEEWAERNHRQSLQELADRGGLSPGEVIAIMDRRKYMLMPDEAALTLLSRRLDHTV